MEFNLNKKVLKIEELVKKGYKVEFFFDLFPLLISPEGKLVNIFWREFAQGPTIQGFIPIFHFTKIKEWSYWIFIFLFVTFQENILGSNAVFGLFSTAFWGFQVICAFTYPYFVYDSNKRGIKAYSNSKAGIITFVFLVILYLAYLFNTFMGA